MRNDIPILLLAAGLSARMRGRDKLLEQIGGTPLLLRQIARLRQASDAQIYVTLPPAPHPRHGLVEAAQVHGIPVADAADGMHASLRAGLAALPPAEAVMIVLADMPDLTAEDFAHVLQAVDLHSDRLIWRATGADGTPGHPIVFRAALWPELMRGTGDQGGRAVIQAHRDRVAHVPLQADHALTDLDTPEAWDAWRARHDAD